MSSCIPGIKLIVIFQQLFAREYIQKKPPVDESVKLNGKNSSFIFELELCISNIEEFAYMADALNAFGVKEEIPVKGYIVPLININFTGVKVKVISHIPLIFCV